MTIPDPMSWDTNPQQDATSPSALENHETSSDSDRNTAGEEEQSMEGSHHRQNDENHVSMPTSDDNRSNSNNDDDDKADNNEDSPQQVHESEIMFSIESFGAIVSPVSITMILSALAVVFLNTEETLAAGEEAYAQTYQIIDLQEGNAAQNLGASLANTLVIVIIICFMTFVIVLLYKYRCMKIFYGYMVVVTTLILGYYTASMFKVAIDIYGWTVDKLSFVLVMYNYAMVGTLAIFYQRGISQWVTQGYLITSSVCLAWQFAYLDSWMAWTLLVMLALYDLFAVLSPCGPLKALAKMISAPGAPQLPGLLYEATLPNGIAKPKRARRESQAGVLGDNHNTIAEEEKTEEDAENSDNQEADDKRIPGSRASSNANTYGESTQTSEMDDGRLETHNDSRSNFGDEKGPLQSHRSQTPTKSTRRSNHTMIQELTSTRSSKKRDHNAAVDLEELSQDIDTTNTDSIPLALAKLYNLNILDPKGVLRQGRFSATWKKFYTAEEVREGSWSPKQLRSEVTAIFPPRGGIISKAEEQKYDAGVAYIVYNRSGEGMRKFVVTRDGKVMQVLRRDPNERPSSGGDDDEPSTIKLGIGDFVFYSLLVAKAAQYSFTTFVTCFFVVLFGLAGTLVILALKGKALPALPISIGLGVLFFLGTKELIQPWIHSVLRQNFYV
jgi:Presenilin